MTGRSHHYVKKVSDTVSVLNVSCYCFYRAPWNNVEADIIASFFFVLVLLSYSGGHVLLVDYNICRNVLQLRQELEVRGCQIKTSCEVYSVSASDNG